MDKVDLTKRLAFVRYLYQIGKQQAEAPLPYGAISVLSFQDSIEWFLLTACEYFDVAVPSDAGAKAYFDRLSRTNGLALTGKIALDKVSSTRNGLKHRLTIPSSITLHDLQVLTNNFLEENTATLFEMDFSNVSMLDLIISEEVKNYMKNARMRMSENQYEKALICIIIAFRTLYQTFELNLLSSWWISAGVDQFDLRLFHRFVPTEAIYMTEGEQFALSRPATRTACDFCFEFVLDTAVKVEQRLHDKLAKLQKIMEAEVEEAEQTRSVTLEPERVGQT